MLRRLRRVLLFLVLAVAGLGLLAVAVAAKQGTRPPTGRPEYVALGSSFAAGAGLGPLQAGSPFLCARSVNGYPQHLARLTGLSIVDMTCGGAQTRHLLRGGQFFQGPQIAPIDARTRLVTITVGGNDIGYVGDLSLLAARRSSTPLGWLARSFWKGPKPVDARDYDRPRRELSATIRAIRRRAPDATVVVATYPALLPPSGTCPALGLTPAEADLMRAVAERLAETTRSTARDAGARVVDMHRLGAAHSPCAAEPWTAGWLDAGAAPFHPTRAGAEAVARSVATLVA